MGQWFVKRRATASGIVAAGASLGGNWSTSLLSLFSHSTAVPRYHLPDHVLSHDRPHRIRVDRAHDRFREHGPLFL
jgi:hypothetical protein